MSASFTVEDPGAGDLGGVSALSRKLLSLSEDVGTLVYTLRSMAGELNETWTGEAAVAARDKAPALAGQFDALGLPLYEGSTKVAQYVSFVEDIDGRAKPLKSKLAELRQVRANLSLGLFEAQIYTGGNSSYVSSVGAATSYDSASQHLTAAGKAAAKRALNARKADLTAEIGTAEPQSGVLGQLAALFDERQTFEVSYAAALDGLIPPELRSALIAIETAAGHDTATAMALFSTPEQLLVLVGGLSKDELRKLMKQHPDLAQKLHRADPNFVFQWWTSLEDDQRKDLIDTIPAGIGSLDGIPPNDRVAANKENAKTLIDDNDKRIKELEDQLDDPFFGLQGRRPAVEAAPPTRNEMQAEVDRLKRENTYLQKAVDGDVKLYLYDRDEDRIIEMFGDPDTATQRMNWVPGTMSTLDKFYSGYITAEPKRLAEETGALVLVCKDGSFPQWAGGGPFPGYSPAMTELGEKLARMEAGMDAAGFGNVRTTTVGHSAGLPIVTASEEAGAYYDATVSLSGAGVNSNWSPDPGTKYYDYTTDGDLIKGIRGISLSVGLPFQEPVDFLGYPQAPTEDNGFQVLDSGIKAEGLGVGDNWFTDAAAVVVSPGYRIVDGVVTAIEGISTHMQISSAETSTTVHKGLINIIDGENPAGAR